MLGLENEVLLNDFESADENKGLYCFRKPEF